MLTIGSTDLVSMYLHSLAGVRPLFVQNLRTGETDQTLDTSGENKIQGKYQIDV